MNSIALDPQKLVAQKESLLDVHNTASQTLSLAIPAVRETLKEKAVEMEAVWHLATETDDWVEKTSFQVRCVCRHFGQSVLKARSKGSYPAWMKPFASELGLTEQGQGDDNDDKGKVNWTYGYDSSLQAI